MKRLALSMLCSMLMHLGLGAEESLVEERGPTSATEGIFTHFDHQTEEFGLANAYLSAYAIQIASVDQGGEILASSGFDRVVEVAGAEEGVTRVILAANKEMVLAVFNRPAHASMAKLWAFLQVGLTDGTGWEGEGCKIHSGCADGLDEIWDGLVADLKSLRRAGQQVWLAAMDWVGLWPC